MGNMAEGEEPMAEQAIILVRQREEQPQKKEQQEEEEQTDFESHCESS